MGYRSDGTIVVAFESLQDMNEVLAVYRLDPRVQKLNPFQRHIDDDDERGNWTFHDWHLAYKMCYHASRFLWLEVLSRIRGHTSI